MPIRDREARNRYERERRKKLRAKARVEREKLAEYLAKRQKPEPEWWARARKLRYRSVRVQRDGRSAVTKAKRSAREIGKIVGKTPYAVLMALSPRKRKARLKRLRESGENKRRWLIRKLKDTSTELPKYKRLSKQERDIRNAEYAKKRAAANPGGDHAVPCNP